MYFVWPHPLYSPWLGILYFTVGTLYGCIHIAYFVSLVTHEYVLCLAQSIVQPLVWDSVLYSRYIIVRLHKFRVFCIISHPWVCTLSGLIHCTAPGWDTVLYGRTLYGRINIAYFVSLDTHAYVMISRFLVDSQFLSTSTQGVRLDVVKSIFFS